ncbi:MAG: CHASE2 domain-containing protein [Phycisphaerae bacterium]
MITRQRQLQLAAFGAGVAGAALVLATYLFGGLEWLELKTLDWRFLYANTVRADSRIVCIDIDDSSLEIVGRWPWSRAEQSALIRVPAECGARALLVDITYVEGEPLALQPPPDADLLLDPLTVSPADLEIVAPDDELARAIADAGNVFLAFHHRERDLFAGEAFDKLVAADGGDSSALDNLALRFAPIPAARIRDAARLAFALEGAPGLSASELAERTGMSPDFVDRNFEAARGLSLRRILRTEWRGAPPTDGVDAMRAIYERFCDKPFDNDSGFKRALLGAWRAALGDAAAADHALASDCAAAQVAQPVDSIAPIYFRHARAARGIGFVTFEPDRDGVMRHMGLFAKRGEQVFPQLALALACNVLGVSPGGISVRGDVLTLRSADGVTYAMQLDERGRTVLPWVAPRRGVSPNQPFVHIPASRLIEVHDRRRQVGENRRAIRDTTERVRASDYFADAAQYAELLRALKQTREQIRIADLRRAGDARAAQEALAQIEPRVAELETGGLTRIEQRFAELSRRPAAELATAEQLEFDTLEALTKALRSREPYESANQRLDREISQTLEWLRARLDGKLCLLGYTATSLADMTPIPTSRRAPGVLAHASLLNSLLTRRTIGWASTAVNALIGAILAVACAATSALLRPRMSVVFSAALLVAFAALCAGLFAWRDYWLAATPATLGVAAALAAVSVYRYVFIDRERRQLSTALSQYTSKAIARQVADNAELCRKAEMREVTAMFTDLRGFTGISERIGAERTQRVLNACLGRFTDVMLRHDAMVNKFIGDGVFAFWNPVIIPQADHALRACETAIDLFDALRRLIAEQAAHGGDAAFRDLMLRVGVATGNAVVGPCGSEQKYDYTCIGDSVNVAARLESANKFYGTQILVSQDTRNQAGERFVYRPLGAVQVKGKTTGVPIYELLGRSGEVDAARVEYAGEFGEAVKLFRARRFSEARDRFAEFARRWPDDLAAVAYLEATAGAIATPPPEDWNGAIALTEK